MAYCEIDRVRRRAMCVVAALLLVGVVAHTRVAADTIGVTPTAPEFALSGVSVAYDANGGMLSITGTSNFYTNAPPAGGPVLGGSTSPFDYTPPGSFTLQ